MTKRIEMPPQDPLISSDNHKEDRPSGSGTRSSSFESSDEPCDDNEMFPTTRPAGERERLESARALRPSQANVLVNRRRSFIVQFSEMKGPPQIALLLTLLAIGLGSTIGVVPAIMGDRFARLGHGYEGEAHCSSFTDNNKPEACFLGGSDAQAAASTANLISNSLTFLTASLTGSLSDEYGRKAPLLMGLIMSMIPSFCLYVMQNIPMMSPWWYYSASASTGLISWFAVALSALNDVLPQEFRAPGIGLLFAGFLFGVCLSPTLALMLERKTLTLVSFLVVCLGFLMTVFVVPETVKPHLGEEAKKLRKERDAKEDERDREKVEELEQQQQQHLFSWLLRFYYSSSVCRTTRGIVSRPFREMSILNRNSFFRLISAVAFFTGVVASADQVLLVYYLEQQLNFNTKDISVMFLIIGVTGIFVQVVVMKPLNDMVGEKMVVALSFMAGTLGNFLYGVARNKSVIFMAILISGLGSMSFPTISAIKANNVKSSEQGRIQGALYSVQALASGLGPAMMQYVYSKTKTMHGFLLGPGTMFIFASGLYVVGIGFALALPNDKANTNPRHGGRPNAQAGSSNSISNNGLVTIDDEALSEYRRLASDSESDEDYGSL